MEDSVLILIVNQEKLDQRKSSKRIKKKAIIFEAKTLNQAETATWILKYANNKTYKFLMNRFRN